MGMRDLLDIDHVHPPSGPKDFIRRIGADQAVMFLCYSRSVWGCWTHWDGRRSQPHFKKKGACPGCKQGHPKRWKGYLDVFNSNEGQREFLEITPGMNEAFEKEIPAGESLAGQRFTFKRGKGQKARCQLTLHAHISVVKPGAVLPQPKDPCDTLMSLWNLVDVADQLGDGDEGVENLRVG